MEFEIVTRKENPFLERTEIRFRITHDNEAGITREKVREKITSTLSAQKDCVIIDSLHSEFGKPEIAGYAKIYRNKESCLKNERKHILVRNKLIEPEKKEEKKKAAPPQKKEEGKGGGAPAPAKSEEKKEEKKDDRKDDKKPAAKPAGGDAKPKEGAEKGKPPAK
jgi:small subunit ribosomal protein S24e